MFNAKNQKQQLKGKKLLFTWFTVLDTQRLTAIISAYFFFPFKKCSATTESTSKVSSTLKSIVIGRPSTTTPAAQPEEEEEVCSILIDGKSFYFSL